MLPIAYRFLIRLSLGYPGLEEEARMLARLQHRHPIDELRPVVSAAEGSGKDPSMARSSARAVSATRSSDSPVSRSALALPKKVRRILRKAGLLTAGD